MSKGPFGHGTEQPNRTYAPAKQQPEGAVTRAVTHRARPHSSGSTNGPVRTRKFKDRAAFDAAVKEVQDRHGRTCDPNNAAFHNARGSW